MSGLKSLINDTAIYGISSIVGRFLNWLLVPLYTSCFSTQEYGIVSYLYSYTAIALIILNYGMETGFFRFASKRDNPLTVYSTALYSVGFTSLLFIAFLTVFLPQISGIIQMSDHKEFVWLIGITVAVDAFTNIPFAYLRFNKRARRFAIIKMSNILVLIALNIFFIIICPKIYKTYPQIICWFYTPLGGEEFGVGWIFIANILASLITLLLLSRDLIGFRWKFDSLLLKRMLNYSWPLLALGVAGTFSHNMGQLIIPYIFKDNPIAAQQLVGIYSANIKIAVIMVMFTQAFRYAYEPFIFSRGGDNRKDKNQTYCDAMKWFVIVTLLIFMAVMFFLPILGNFIGKNFRSGLDVVPIVMAAEICFGIYFNLSIWYKLADKTIWGMWFSIITFILMLALNILLVPRYGIEHGYIGSAWASLISYGAITVVSWLIGQHYFPLAYPIGRMIFYACIAGILTYIGLKLTGILPAILGWTVKLSFLLFFTLFIARKEVLPLLKNR